MAGSVQIESEVVFFGVEARLSFADRIQSAQRTFLFVPSARSGHPGPQPPMAQPEQGLQRIGAAQLHIDPAHAHAHLGRHFQKLQAARCRRWRWASSVPASPRVRIRSSSR